MYLNIHSNIHFVKSKFVVEILLTNKKELPILHFMNYFKVFFYVWKRSFSEASYYKDVLRARFNFSLKYFLFFCFILSIITTIFIIVKELIPFNEFISTFPQELISIYPPELEIKINKGIATTNVPQPYFIPVSRFREAFDEVRKEIKSLQSDKI